MRIFCLLLLICIVMEVRSVPGKIFAGQVHFSRIPVEYWEHRVLMIKAMGMNALSVYVMWNYHETSPGVFDFQTDNRNLSAFLDIAGRNKMAVFIRPGPYVCAEWDLGGMPAWLLESSADANLRTNTPAFMAAVRKYFEAIAPILKKYDAKNGGPIQLLQIENEYGFFGNDITYINSLRQIWADLGVTTDQYHADPSYALSKSHWPGGNMGVNNGITQNDYNIAKSLDPNVYIFGGEIYPGWLTHWGEAWATRSIAETVNHFTFLVTNNISFSMYMAHGGSNFGFTAGANSKDVLVDYEGHITSYDYDAPINEQGSATAKYTALRDLFVKHASWQVPEPPAPIKTTTVAEFLPTAYATLLDNLPAPVMLTNYTHFESKQLKMYNQGIAVYEIKLPADSHEFNIVIHDYAMVFVDGNFHGAFDRQKQKQHSLKFVCNAVCTVRILVEAMGHINFDKGMNTDRKGLIKFERVKGSGALTEWKAYKLPLDFNYVKAANVLKDKQFPVFAKHTFDLATVGDTFLNMSKYFKGYVWVNGRNLGRFWNKGPQHKLFCPGVWLRNKGNEVYILELGEAQIKPITGDTTLKTEQITMTTE